KVRMAGNLVEALQPGRRYEQSQLQLDAEQRFSVNVEIRHRQYFEERDETHVGVHFHQPATPAQRQIDRFVTHLQREARRLAAREAPLLRAGASLLCFQPGRCSPSSSSTASSAIGSSSCICSITTCSSTRGSIAAARGGVARLPAAGMNWTGASSTRFSPVTRSGRTNTTSSRLLQAMNTYSIPGPASSISAAPNRGPALAPRPKVIRSVAASWTRRS